MAVVFSLDLSWLSPLFIFVGVVLFIFAQTAKGAQAIGFIGSARMEVRKVVWPSRQETIQTALIVFAMVIIVGLILWLLLGPK